MLKLNRRRALQSGFSLAIGGRYLAACGAAPLGDAGKTRVHVMGMIHSRHRTSETYSLDVLKTAVLRANPDVILTEIPPSRVEKAVQTFKDTGKVDEPRTNVFPEYTDVIIPLAQTQGWQILGTAAWTPELARNRRKALDAIAKDPLRAQQWSEHRAAIREFGQKTRGRSDAPEFIHTSEFDRLVAASREPYARYFDGDLGPGGWTQINQAHNALIDTALNSVSGQGLRVLITFGSAHKYKILESLAERGDVSIGDTNALFV